MVADLQHRMAAVSFTGAMDQYARFIEENQLLLEEDWYLFVNQFRSGVDDADAGWRGEYFGKMMRGAAMTYRYTKNEKLYDLLTKIAEEMLTTQDDLGRFSSYSVEKEFIGWDMWSRKYVLLGYLHYLEICRDENLKNRIMAAPWRPAGLLLYDLCGIIRKQTALGNPSAVVFTVFGFWHRPWGIYPSFGGTACRNRPRRKNEGLR